MFVTYLIVALIVVLITRKILNFKRFKQRFDHVPGYKDFNYILGNLHFFAGYNDKGMKQVYDMANEHKAMFCVWFGGNLPILYLYHPELMQKMSKPPFRKPRGNWYWSSVIDMGIPWLGEGILLADSGPRWLRNRRLLTPSFHFDILKGYITIYNDCADILVKRFNELGQGGESLDISKVMSLQTLDVVLRCACSYESNCQEKGSEYVVAIQELSKLWSERTLHPSHMFNFIYSMLPEGRRFRKLCKFVHEVSDGIISERRKALKNKEPDNRKVKDFLDTLLVARDGDGQGLDAKEIRQEVDTFMFAGHDTTSVGMTFTLYCLAKHPEYQDKMLKEIKEVLGDRESLEWQDLSKLDMTTMIIKESLRMFPPVPQIAKMVDEDMELYGHKIPKGCYSVVAIFALHRNPHVWENPHDFIPERFHPDKAKDMDPWQFMPFSGGSRNCIGQHFAMNELKTIIPKVVQNFHLSVDESKPMIPKMEITMASENGVNLFVTPRKK